MRIALYTFLSFCLSVPVFSASNDPMSFAGKAEVNGLHLSDFKDFSKEWHFVTVRYRKDTAEMRFTYANDAAWAALTQGSRDYPPGAVFAKVGFATQDDAAFPSSSVPKSIRRYQFMVRDRVKYKNTDGWGYALFDAAGLSFPEDPKTTEKACAACHKLVPERGFVFSESMQHLALAEPFFSGKLELSEKLAFTNEPTQNLPLEVFKKLPPNLKFVRFLTGELRRSLFQGTLDEIRPALAKEAGRSKLPAILLSEDGLRYVLVFQSQGTECAKETRAYKSLSNIYFNTVQKNYEISFCL